MTERLRLTPCEPFALIAIDLWSDTHRLADLLGTDPPSLGCSTPLTGGWRVMRLEPTVWWLVGPRAALTERLTVLREFLDDAGGVTDLSDGFDGVRITGPGWRELLTIGGVFDAENPAFRPGCTAGTILHHVAVRYDVIAAEEVCVFIPPSYVEYLSHPWRDAVARLSA